MTGLICELGSVLTKETELYTEILNLNKEKREAVIERDSDNLEMITGREEKFISNLSALAKEREKILSDIATVLGKNEKKITVSDVIEALECKKSEQKELIEKRDKLSKVAGELRYWNEQNQELLKTALELVDFDLTLFRSVKQAPETANYNNKAYNTGDLLGSSGFDTKQ